MKANGKSTPHMADLLLTKDKEEQARRVEQLINLGGAPVVDIVVRYDPRFQGPPMIVAFGGQLEIEQAILVLENAVDSLRAKLVETLRQQAEEGKGDTAPIVNQG